MEFYTSILEKTILKLESLTLILKFKVDSLNLYLEFPNEILEFPTLRLKTNFYLGFSNLNAERTNLEGGIFNLNVGVMIMINL